MSFSMLAEAVMRELQLENRKPFLERDDGVTSAPDPLSNPQSRRKPTEVHYVA